MSISRSVITSAANITWAGGTLFNGWLLLIISPPTLSGAAFTTISLRDSSPKIKVPLRVRIAIREGVLDSNAKVFQSSSLVPTNAVYSAWFYDDNNRLIATGSSLFTITADPYTLTIPSLTDPTAVVSPPVPEDAPTTSVTTVTYNAPTEETPGGTQNGTNLVFTISKAGTIVFIVRNGAVLTPGVDFNQSTTTITFTAGNAPLADDILKAIIF